MPTLDFVDQVRLSLAAGHGGRGSAHFRRERYVPKGGPDGGDGGRGGHIIVVGNPHRNTLLHLRYHKHVHATAGQDGARQQAHGADGKDRTLEVPLGTVIREEATGKVLCEVTTAHQSHILLQGGKGGRGNVHFKSSTQQAPRYAQPGREGAVAEVLLELKVLADVGLIGPPNAGKSTLLATLSAARPTIAHYPFTTLTPQLGVVAYHEHTFVMAEVPGLIAGASQGKGLGLRFLRHAERSRVLLCMLPADADDLRQAYDTLVHELTAYSPALAAKPRFLALTKVDLCTPQEVATCRATLPADLPLVPLSAVTGQGLHTLKDTLWRYLAS